MLQQQDILRASQLSSSKQAVKSMDDSIVADSEVTWLADFLLSISIDDISENDANIVFLLAVTLDAATPLRHKCSLCKTMLVKSEDIPMKTQKSLN